MDTDICQHTQSLRHPRQRYKRAPGFGARPAQLYPTEVSFYLLRATSKAGAYAGLFPSLVRSWQNMVKDNLTT